MKKLVMFRTGMWRRDWVKALIPRVIYHYRIGQPNTKGLGWLGWAVFFE